MNNRECISRFERLRSERQVIQEIWDYIERYIAPYRGKFFKDERSESSQEWRKPWVYDSTAVMAQQNLASSLHSSLTSPAAQWFNLRFRDDELNDNQEARAWLEDCAKIVYSELQDSNFNIEINESYNDLTAFGTSFLIEEELKDDTDSLINFKSIPIKECYFEVDTRNRLVNFYRHLQWTLVQMRSFFGDDNLPKDILDEAKDKNSDPNKKYDIVFVVYRRFGIDTDGNIGKILAPEKRPFGYKYLLLNDATMLGDEGGYYEMPAFAPRWRTTSQSMWGNSPAMIALSDTMSLNRTIELNFAAVEKALDPPTLTTQRGLIGDLDLNAGGLTVCRDLDELRTHESKSRFDVSYEEMNRLRDNIEKYFFIPQLMLPPMQGTPATATEISVRMMQLERLIGPTLGRIQTDLLDPVVTRTFRILLRAKKLPEMPDIIREMGGKADVEYTGPMAKTQEASNVQAIERYAMFIANLSQVNPEILDIPDWDEMAKTGATMMGVPAKMIKTKDAVKQIRAKRRTTQNMQAQGEAMQAMGEGKQAMAAAGMGGGTGGGMPQ